MKILIYGINFAPELTGIGKYTGEMVDWLVAQGHEVRVVTAPPYYPAWRVASPYSALRYQREESGASSVAVWRCPLWVPHRVSGARRLLHLASFALSSFPVMLRQVFWRPDVVWVAVPALMCAPAAWLAARLCGAQALLHVQDFEVDAAFDLGLLRNRWARRLALWLERVLLRRFDCVSTISRRMLALAQAKGVAHECAVLFPNWADLSAVQPEAVAAASPYRRELYIPPDAVVALYSGNMSAKQGLEILPRVARQIAATHPEIHFVFCGQGAGRDAFQLACAGLLNVHLLPLQPLERLGELLACADIHLLPQRADAADLVMPSKLTGMLASGRPVVATARPDTELAEVVHGCGIVVPPDDVDALAQAVVRLAHDESLRHQLGAAARRYAEENLDRDRVLSRYEAVLKARCGVVSQVVSDSAA